MGKNNKRIDANNQKIENGVNEETKQVVEETQVVEKTTAMTDAEIAQKYHLDEHSWEGTVAIWKIKKELGIK